MAKQFLPDTGGTLTTGLVSYYKLNDTTDFYDGHNLTNVGGVVFDAGKVNNGADLGTSNTSKALSLGTKIVPSKSAPHSVSMWIKPNALPANNTYTGPLTLSIEGGTEGIAFQNVSGVYQLIYQRYYMSGVNVAENFTYNFSPTVGTWFHVAFVYDGSNIQAYYNGSNVGSVASGSSAASYYQDAFILGAGNNNVTSGPAGSWASVSIDEVGVWTKALSTTEITDLWNNNNGQTMIDPVGPINMKTRNGLVSASIKTINGLAIASVKTVNGLT